MQAFTRSLVGVLVLCCVSADLEARGRLRSRRQYRCCPVPSCTVQYCAPCGPVQYRSLSGPCRDAQYVDSQSICYSDGAGSGMPTFYLSAKGDNSTTYDDGAGALQPNHVHAKVLTGACSAVSFQPDNTWESRTLANSQSPWEFDKNIPAGGEICPTPNGADYCLVVVWEYESTDPNTGMPVAIYKLAETKTYSVKANCGYPMNALRR